MLSSFFEGKVTKKGEPNISYWIKKIAVSFTANLLKTLLWLGGRLAVFSRRHLRRPLVGAGGFFVTFSLLPTYRVYLFLKRHLGKIYQPTGNKFWDIVTHRYIVHGVIILFGLLIVGNNIQARVSGFRNEDYGKKTMLYALVGGEETALIEESGQDIMAEPTADYLSEIGGVRSGASGLITNEPAEAPMVDSGILTQGGGALVKPDLSGMEEAGGARQVEEVYVVQPGETISSIAGKFGVSVYTILWENNLTERSYIRPGDKLVILPANGIKHKVARGEALDKIAAKYKIDKQIIVDYNDLIDESGLKIGQTLFIPGGKKLPTVVVPKAPSGSRAVQSYVGAVPGSAALSDTKLQWPTSVRKITQYFGWRHTGVDIADRNSPPVYAAEAGTVVRAQASGWNGGYGNNIIIDHGNGLQTLYGHMKTLFVSAGDKVSRGQTIGIMGNTGRSTGPHLHFEVRSNGARLNPLSYIR